MLVASRKSGMREGYGHGRGTFLAREYERRTLGSAITELKSSQLKLKIPELYSISGSAITEKGG
jgi:hypothetical protein